MEPFGRQDRGAKVLRTVTGMRRQQADDGSLAELMVTINFKQLLEE